MIKEILRKLVGVIGAMGIGFGMLFMLQRYPGATYILSVGIVFRFLQFSLTPSAFRSFSPFGAIRKNQPIALHIFQGISIATVIVSVLFKIQHYPGVSFLSIVGWTLLTATMIFKSLQRLKEEREEVDISEFGKR